MPIQGSVKPPAEGEGWPVALQTLNMWPYCLLELFIPLLALFSVQSLLHPHREQGTAVGGFHFKSRSPV